MQLNKIQKLLYVLLVISLIALVRPATPRQFGMITSLLLMPFFAWWLGVHLSNGKRSVARSGFTVVLLFALIAVGKRGVDAFQERDMNRSIEKEKSEYKRTLLQNEDPQTVAAAFDDYVDTLQNSLNTVTENATGDKKAYYTVMRDFTLYSEEVVRSWQNSMNAVLNSSVYDYSFVLDDEEFLKNINLIDAFIEESKNYITFFDSSTRDLITRLKVLGEDNQYAKDAVQKHRNSMKLQRGPLTDLINEHIASAEDMKKILNLLHSNKEKWHYFNGELSISNESFKREINVALTSFNAHQSKVMELSKSLVASL